MLVDHPDTAGDGVFGIVYLHPLAVDEDLTLVGFVEAVEDLHQGRLARPVLAEEAEDFTPVQDERDVVVGRDGAEALGDAPHLQDDGGVRRLRSRTRLPTAVCRGP